MTTMRLTRCSHCGVGYTYYPSGNIEHPELNDKFYCPECKAVINEALSFIRVKIKKRWIPTTDYTADQIKEAHKESMKPKPAQPGILSFPPMQRVLFGLVKVETGEAEQTLCVRMNNPNGRGKHYYGLSMI